MCVLGHSVYKNIIQSKNFTIFYIKIMKLKKNYCIHTDVIMHKEQKSNV